jgi:hypothetical protein
MFRILCEDLMMLRFSNTKSSMLYNLLSVDEAQMFVFEALLEKKQFNMSVPVNMSVHFYSGGSAHKEGSRKEGGAEDHLAQHSVDTTIMGSRNGQATLYLGGRRVSAFMIRLLCLFLLWGGAFHYMFIRCHFSSFNNCQPMPPGTPFCQSLHGNRPIPLR